MDEPINPLLIGGGVAGVVILLVAAVVGFRAYKRKQEAEFEAMMSEDLEEGSEIEESPEELEEPEPVDYNSMTVAQLKEILQERDLTIGGNKAELVARLEEDDIQLAKFKARLGHVEQVVDDDDDDILEDLELEDDDDEIELDEVGDDPEIEDSEEEVQETLDAPEEIGEDEFEEFDEDVREDE